MKKFYLNYKILHYKYNLYLKQMITYKICIVNIL